MRTHRSVVLLLVLISLSWGWASLASSSSPQVPSASSDGEATSEVATATLAMYCYWTGEATLGRVDGVLASRIGHWGGKEIVQVDYDPGRTDLDQMIAALQRQRSFDAVVVGKDEPIPSTDLSPRQVLQARGEPDFIEPKHSLRTRHPNLWALDLDERQAIALNSWSYFGGPMPDVLTEEQKELLKR